MKKMKKIFALLIAMVMVLGMSTSVFAAVTSDSGKGGDASITITLPTDPNAGAEGYTEPTITYTVYKVFDATSAGGTSTAIAYQIDSANGDLTAAMTAAGFSVDSAGNVTGPSGTELSTAAIEAIADYAQDEIGTFTAKPSDGTLTITGLEYGYYYITTTTGAAVTVDSTNPNATVEDKNAIPGPPEKDIVSGEDFIGSIDADGANALAQVGSTVYFEVTITKVKGATNYVFHDVMSDGLDYNDDVAVTPAGAVYDDTAATGDDITLTFDNDWLAELADNTDITITYSATVTSDALSVDYAHNTATLDYGDGNTTDMDQVKVYNAKFTVTKKIDTEDGDPLEGAGFVVLNADDKYYHLENGVVTWVDSEDEATEYTSDEDGAVTAFTGLADGTYTLHEKTVPAGYNQAADSTFTIVEGDYTTTNLEQTAIVPNKTGTELPSTGGIGTTIFYVIGAILVIGAGVVLVTRRRMNVQ